MKKIITSFLALVLAVTHSYGTAQISDTLVYQGEIYNLHTNPLEPYFEKHPDKRPESGSTALWRGYVATFGITNNLLVMTEIEVENVIRNDEGKYDYGFKSIKDDLFPDISSLPIDWFSGILVLPYGELEEYVHMGYGLTFSNYILLEVNNGKIGKEKRYTSEQYKIFKERQFQAFKKTDEYQKLIEEMDKEGYAPEQHDDFLRSFITKYTSKILDDSEIEVPPKEEAKEKMCSCGNHSALPAHPLDEEQIAVFYATKDLQKGDLLTDETIVFRWTNNDELPKHFVRMNDLFNILDSKMAFPIKEGEIVTWYHTEIPDYIKQKSHNQRVDPTVKTPVESVKVQGTAGHP